MLDVDLLAYTALVGGLDGGLDKLQPACAADTMLLVALPPEAAPPPVSTQEQGHVEEAHVKRT